MKWLPVTDEYTAIDSRLTPPLRSLMVTSSAKFSALAGLYCHSKFTDASYPRISPFDGYTQTIPEGVGSGVGTGVGLGVGEAVLVGSGVGLGEGCVLGTLEGKGVDGSGVGDTVGQVVGTGEGSVLGTGVGLGVGIKVGLAVCESLNALEDPCTFEVRSRTTIWNRDAEFSPNVRLDGIVQLYALCSSDSAVIVALYLLL